MKQSGTLGAMLIALLLIGSGCTDQLATIDLSGEVELHPSEQGWAYKSIVSGELNRPRIIPHSQLREYRDELELEKTVTIGKNEYLLVTRFTPEFSLRDIFIKAKDQPLKDFQTLVYSYTDHRLMKTFVARQWDQGDDWDSRIDGGPGTNEKERVLQREGVFRAVFHEPSTAKDCLVESTYFIKSVAELVKPSPSAGPESKPMAFTEKYSYGKVRVEGDSEVKIGFRECLTGEMTVEKQRITLHVLDWDLDGQFTPNDVVWNSYTEKLLPFGVPVRLTDSFQKSKDNTYTLKLTKKKLNSQEIDVLQIELVKTGKR